MIAVADTVYMVASFQIKLEWNMHVFHLFTDKKTIFAKDGKQRRLIWQHTQ